MALLVKRAGADEYGSRVKMLLCGDPGSGKTRMSSTFPHVFYANVEGGLMSVVDRQVPFVDIERTEQLNELRMILAFSAAERERRLGVPVDTVVIDTLDAFQRMLSAERLVDIKKDAMGIADWGWLGDQLRAYVRAFRNLDVNVIFTCHIKTSEDGETGETFVKPALQGQMQDEIPQYVDVAGLLKANPETRIIGGEARKVLIRVLQTSPDTRHPWLKDRSGKLPMEMEVNLTSDYAAIHGAMFPTGEVAPPSVAIVPTPAAAAPAVPVKVAPAKVAAPAKRAAPKAEPAPEKVAEKVAPHSEQPITEALAAIPADDVVLLDADSNGTAAVVTAAEVVVATTERPPCAECGGPIETADQLELGLIRFRRPLCKKDFIAMKTAKR